MIPTWVIIAIACALSVAGIIVAFKAAEREELEQETDDAESDFTPRP